MSDKPTDTSQANNQPPQLSRRGFGFYALNIASGAAGGATAGAFKTATNIPSEKVHEKALKIVEQEAQPEWSVAQIIDRYRQAAREVQGEVEKNTATSNRRRISGHAIGGAAVGLGLSKALDSWASKVEEKEKKEKENQKSNNSPPG